MVAFALHMLHAGTERDSVLGMALHSIRAGDRRDERSEVVLW